ncbi:hypothetical protein [Kitasatospora sp. NPDC088134]|uniref:hypothetical protein n=1 Tax=Kitasatospora sp. NPDC088134 TaxID=3364071 RepID=UPI00380FF9CD
MSTEIVQLVEQAGPYLTAAVGAYGAAVLTRAEDAAADATANLGRRLLQTVLRRRPDRAAALETAVDHAVQLPGDQDAAAALRLQFKLALLEDPELRRAITELLPAHAPGSITITASGERSVAAYHIGTAITGDGHPTAG